MHIDQLRSNHLTFVSNTQRFDMAKSPGNDNLRSICFIIVTLTLTLSGVEANEPRERESLNLLTAHGIQPTAEGAIGYLSSLKPDPGVQDHIRKLIEQLGDASFAVRERAYDELLTVGDAAEEPLKLAAKSIELERVLRARRLLRLLPSRQNKGLRDALTLAALQLLKRETSPRASALLLDIFPVLARPPLNVSATEALWANIRPSDEPEIRKAMRGNNPQTRSAAIVALELALGDGAVLELQPLLADEAELIQLATARALINHLPRKCLTTLIRLLDAKELEIRMQAIWLLQDVTGNKLEDDGNQGFDAVVDQWKRWSERNASTAQLAVPVGSQRLDLSRAVIIFREVFAQADPNIQNRYGRFRYESTAPCSASVAEGVLRFDGNHPEADQRLFIEARALTGREEFPANFSVRSELTGEGAGVGAYHVGVSVGRIKVLFHPAYSGGGFRIETTDSHDYLVSNQSMGFTPAAGVMHEMILKVGKGNNGNVSIEVTVVNGSDARQKYVKRFECESKVVGPLHRIGLERSGRTGGAGLFRSLTIDLSGQSDLGKSR